MPETKRKPGRPRISEITQRISNFRKLDSQIIEGDESYYELDISTPAHPNLIMKIDSVDYERLRSDMVGRIIARPSSAFSNELMAFVNTRNKADKFNTTPSFIHTLICKGNGYLWHKNGNLLDNRRENLETDIPLQASTVGKEPQPIPADINMDNWNNCK